MLMQIFFKLRFLSFIYMNVMTKEMVLIPVLLKFCYVGILSVREKNIKRVLSIPNSECKHAITLINVSGMKIFNWIANYSWYFRAVRFNAPPVVLMQPHRTTFSWVTGACCSSHVNLGLPSHQ